MLASPAFAGIDVQKAQGSLTELSKQEKDALIQVPSKPYFLLGLEQRNTAWDKYQELRKMLRTKVARFATSGKTIIDRSAPGYRADTTLQEDVSMFGRNVHVVYLGHHLTEEGMYIIWTKEGERNLAEFSPLYEKYKVRWALGNISDAEWLAVNRLLGWAQFETVRRYIHGVIRQSAVENAEYYKAFDFLGQVIRRRTEILGDPDYARHLDDVVEPKDNLKMQDIIPVPYTRPEDFLPDLFLVGLGKFSGGLAMLKLPQTERVVYVNISALMWDYVMGKNNVSRHEFTHANPYLQNSIWGAYFDLETWDEMATGLYPPNFLDFLSHPYYAHWRDLVKNHFGYDTEEVVRRLYPVDFDGASLTDVNREEFEKNAAQVEIIAGVLRKFVEKLLVEFYIDPFAWAAINTKFCDNAAALRINFMLNFKSAGLFDPEKKDKDGKVIPPEVQTQEWILREMESGRLGRLAEFAMRETGSKVKVKDTPKIFDNLNLKCPIDSKFFLLNERELVQARQILESLWREANAGDMVSRAILRRYFGSLEFLQSLERLSERPAILK